MNAVGRFEVEIFERQGLELFKKLIVRALLNAVKHHALHRRLGELDHCEQVRGLVKIHESQVQQIARPYPHHGLEKFGRGVPLQAEVWHLDLVCDLRIGENLETIPPTFVLLEL